MILLYNMNIVRTRICKESSPDIGVVRGDVIKVVYQRCSNISNEVERGDWQDPCSRFKQKGIQIEEHK